MVNNFAFFVVISSCVFSQSECSPNASECDDIERFAESCGALLYIDDEKKICGALVQSHLFGVGRNPSEAGWIIGDCEPKSNGLDRFVTSSRHAIKPLADVKSMPWFVYFGNGFAKDYSAIEAMRVSDAVSALQNIPDNQAIGLFDCDIEESTFIRLMQLGSKRKILIVNSDVVIDEKLVHIKKLEVPGLTKRSRNDQSSFLFHTIQRISTVVWKLF